MTNEELKDLAIDLAENKIFTSLQIRDIHDLPMIFMPVVFGAFKDMTEEEIKDIGILYEYYSQAGPIGINGNPIFYSFKYLNKADSEELMNLYHAYIEHKKSF